MSSASDDRHTADDEPDLPTSRPPALRVFLAEDDTELRTMIAAVLRGDGHQVVEASSSTMLLMNLARCQVEGRSAPATRDLVLSDVHMPGMDGLNVLRALRASGSRVPPFIFMTGLGDQSCLSDARALGALSVLEKPFEIAELRAVVSEAASGRRG